MVSLGGKDLRSRNHVLKYNAKLPYKLLWLMESVHRHWLVKHYSQNSISITVKYITIILVVSSLHVLVLNFHTADILPPKMKKIGVDEMGGHQIIHFKVSDLSTRQLWQLRLHTTERQYRFYINSLPHEKNS